MFSGWSDSVVPCSGHQRSDGREICSSGTGPTPGSAHRIASASSQTVDISPLDAFLGVQGEAGGQVREAASVCSRAAYHQR